MAETQTMVIRTLNFGEIEVPEEKILHFKEGLPGFAQIQRYVLLDLASVKPFVYLQAIGEPPIAFLLVDPRLVEPGYQYRLAPSDLDDVGVSEASEACVYVVATIPANPEDATVNLMAPIVVNEKLRRGKQVIMLESPYSVRHPMLGTSRGRG
jgi:flagellar assembly factor FliW